METTFRRRLDLALQWANLREAEIADRCRDRGAFQSAIAAAEALRPLAADELSAVLDAASILDVSASWLHCGALSVAAERLVDAMTLADIGGRTTNRAIVLSPGEWDLLLLQASAMPGRPQTAALSNTLFRHLCSPAGGRAVEGSVGESRG